MTSLIPIQDEDETIIMEREWDVYMCLIMKLSDNTVKVIQLSILISSLCANTVLFSLPIVFHFVSVSYQWYQVMIVIYISSLRQ